MTEPSTPSVPDGEQTRLVVVTRDGHPWRAEIASLDAAYRAAPLTRIDGWVRGVLGLRPLDWVNYEFRTGSGNLDRLIREARAARRGAQAADQHARQATRNLLADARHADLSVREIAVLLGLSHQRIQQLNTGIVSAGHDGGWRGRSRR